MGLPMIQVVMIAARQVSKPIADAVIRYGKDHPIFRTKVLIPIGRSIVRLTTRLRMKNLGLGEISTKVQVSETAALEQASEFVQQVILFSYSVGVFAGFYFYQKYTTPDTLKADEFEAFKTEHKKVIEDLQERVALLEQSLAAKGKKVEKKSPPPAAAPPSATAAPTQSAPEKSKSAPATSQSAPTTPTESSKRFARLSSLPLDDAVRIVLEDGSKWLVLRRGTSVAIEMDDDSARDFSFRKRPVLIAPPRRGVIGYAENFVASMLGRYHE